MSTAVLDPAAAAACAGRLVAAPLPGAPAGAGAPLGAVVGLLVGDERTIAAHGVSDPATSQPETPDLRHDLASVTKVLGTTTALASLVADAALTWDTEVCDLVPTFPGHPGTTVRHLLLHRGGLPAWQPLYLAPERAAALDAIGPSAPLDAAYCYSDLGFLHLGRVVEAAASAPLADAVRELSLVPLGIPGAGYRPGAAGDAAGAAPSSWGDAAERRMVATGDPYPVRWPDDGFPWREHLLRGEANDGNCWHAFGGVAGHAGLFATVDELLTAGRALAMSVAGDGPLPAHLARELVEPGPDPAQALGFRRDGDWAWHPGYTGCAVGFLPGRPVVVAVATNRLLAQGAPTPTPLLWRAAVAALTAEPAPAPRGAA